MSVSAKETLLQTETNDGNIGCTEFDINDNPKCKSVLKQYGITEEEVIGVYQYSDEDESRIAVPGWIILTGKC